MTAAMWTYLQWIAFDTSKLPYWITCDISRGMQDIQGWIPFTKVTTARKKERERRKKKKKKKNPSPIKQLVSALLGQPSWPDVGKVKPKTNVSSGLSYHGQLVTAAVRVLQLQTGICRGKVHGLQVQVWRCKRALDSDNFWSGKNGKLFSSGQKKTQNQNKTKKSAATKALLVFCSDNRC